MLWYSAGFECVRSRVQSPIKDRVIPKTFKIISVVPLYITQHQKGNTGSFSNSNMFLCKID